MTHTGDQLTILEHDSVEALREWLVDHPVRNEDGAVMLWMDGSPVALTVLKVIDRIRAQVRAQERFEAQRASYFPRVRY